MRRSTVWILARIVVIAFVLTVVVPIIIRGVFRYHTLQNLMPNLADARRRIAVTLETKTLPAPTSIQPVNLGYATFDTGTTGSVYIATEGDQGTVVITNAAFVLRLGAPSETGGLTNLVATEIEIEKTDMLPISQVALMSQRDFRVYAITLASKAEMHWGGNEIWSFTTPHITGIVRVGEGPDDRQRAIVHLATLDGTRNVMMLLNIAPGSSRDIAHILDPILASYQFTIDKATDRDEIKRLISQAGIPLRPTK